MTLFFSRWQKIVLAALVLALLSGVAALMYGRGRLAALDTGEPFFVDAADADRNSHSILVDITGAVKKPGLYRISAAARLHEALKKARRRPAGGRPQHSQSCCFTARWRKRRLFRYKELLHLYLRMGRCFRHR